MHLESCVTFHKEVIAVRLIYLKGRTHLLDCLCIFHYGFYESADTENMDYYEPKLQGGVITMATLMWNCFQ